MVDVRIIEGGIDCDSALGQGYGDEHGAQAIFFGHVRKVNLGRKVRAVSYDLHPALAVSELKRIAGEALGKWGSDLWIRIWHSKGRLEVGETSVAIVVASVHRDEAYRASRFLIEELKHKAPIWKKEHYVDGETQWLKGCELCGVPDLELRARSFSSY